MSTIQSPDSSLSADCANLDSLIPEIYHQLKKIALNHIRNERINYTLSPTELVHEVYLAIQKNSSLKIQNRLEFLGLASTVMRHILVNYAKRRLRKKRGGGNTFAGFDELCGNYQDAVTFVEFERHEVNVIALEKSLNELAKFDLRQVRIVELHFYGGLTFEEISQIMNLSLRTVQREWNFAKTWLYRYLVQI